MVFRKIAKKLKYLATTASDRAKYALVSIGFLLKKPKYLAVFLFALFIFLFLLTLFKDGSSNMSLLFSGISFELKMELLGRIVAEMLGNFTSLYGITIIFMSLLQALVVMLLVFAWQHREKDHAIDGASTGGIGAIFGFVALGCPACGVTLLAPIITAIAGTGAMAAAEGASYILAIAAFILLFYTVVKLGYVSFIVISTSKYKEKEHAKSH